MLNLRKRRLPEVEATFTRTVWVVPSSARISWATPALLQFNRSSDDWGV